MASNATTVTATAACLHPPASPPVEPKYSLTPSANPIPIQPTRAKELFPERPPVSPAHRGHPRRLIIEVWPQIPPQEREMGRKIVAAINESLRITNAPSNIAITAVLYSLAGNPIVIAEPSCSASDLLPYSTLIARAIWPRHERAHGRLDNQYYRVKLDHVPTKHYDQTPITTEDVEAEIAVNFAEYPSLIRPLPARWLASADKRAVQRSASMVFAFTTEADARRFHKENTIFAFAMPCKTAQFEERSPRPRGTKEPQRTEQHDSPIMPDNPAVLPSLPTGPDALTEERRVRTDNEKKRKLTGESNSGPEAIRARTQTTDTPDQARDWSRYAEG